MKRLKEFDALVVRSRTKVPAALIETAEKLKVIGRAGTGLDNIDVGAATKRGIAVMNTPGGNTVTTAEHALSLLFSLSRNVPQATASLKAGKWEKKKFQGRELFNKTLGVVGFGNIGSVVADRAKGIRMMNVVLEERPDYHWAWQQLADWYKATGSREGYERAAERLAELDPHNPVPLVYHAEARMAAGDRDGAKADLARALALAPDYSYAGTNLFDLYVEDNQLAEAEKVVETLMRAAGDDFVKMRLVELRVRQNRGADALEEFRKMCAAEVTDHNALRGVGMGIEESIGREELVATLEASLKEPAPCPEAAAILAGKLCEAGDFEGCLALVGRLSGRAELWEHAAAAYVEGLGQYRRAGDLHRQTLSGFPQIFV